MTETLIDTKRFKQQGDDLRRMFMEEKTGKQTLFTEQSKLFEPLIEVQKETSKSIEAKIKEGQDTTSNALVPFTRELQKRNDQVETLQNLPFYNLPPEIEGVPQSTPVKETLLIDINMDKGLDKTQREDLQDMSFDLPSVVFQKGTVEETLERIKTENKRIGAFLGKSSKKAEKEKEVYESQKQTLILYKKRIKGIEANQPIVIPKKIGKGIKPLCKPKRGRGRPKTSIDPIIYSNPNDLIIKLMESDASKQAGNTGMDNVINSILDEMLKIKTINKNDYDILYKNIFGSNI
jgi:hypothetical protein